MKNCVKIALSALIIFAITFAFSACADENQGESTAAPTTAESTTAPTTAESTTAPTTAEKLTTAPRPSTTKKPAVTKAPETTKKPSPKPQPTAALKEYPVTILINKDNRVPNDFKTNLVNCGGGHKVDKRAYNDLQDMLNGARKAGYSPEIRSSYRTHEYQKNLYANRVKRCMNEEGCSRAEAEKRAAMWVAIPGTSEHETGLALDIVSKENQNLDESQAKTGCQKWLMEHSWEYGFILRYPNDKISVTKINYEPWHYRYVGKELAGELHGKGICLEEYYM